MKNKVYALLHIFQPVQWTRLTHFVYGSSVCYLLCSLYGKELMLSFSSTHISKSPVIRYISGNEGDLIHHMLMFDHLRNVDKDFRFCLLFFFFFKALQINSVKSRLYCNSNQNSRPISHQWSWCLTWKCWPRSSACACLATEQLLPYPGEKKQKHYSIEGKWYPPNRCIYTKAQLNSFKKQFWYFLHENQR